MDKCTERVPLNLTEQELLDLSRMATVDDRALGEFIRLRVIRPFLYGNSKRVRVDVNETNGSDEDR